MNRKKITFVFNAPVILCFVIACFGVLLLNQFTGGATNPRFFMTYHSSLSNLMTYVRFFTHVLGHSGWEHFIANMVYILLLGPMLEEKYGSWTILEVILATALATGLINYFFFPKVALLGASGICFAFIILSSLTSFKKGEIPITFILVAAMFIGQQVLDGLFASDNISQMAHIVGGSIGALFGFLLNKH
ncbi:MAG: rhomboid family intramembrane serine protease [Firmicutes bacterium]|nr:rhomboid family intramembrane serine protease [Bacillota bacterium]